MTVLQRTGLVHRRDLHAAARLTVTILTTEVDVASLFPEWDALWRRVSDASPFISPDWLWSWWRHLGGGALRVFTARVDGRLVAILPLFIWDNAGVRQLLPLGISVSDAFDLLAEPSWLRPVQDLLGPLLSEGGDWDRCELHEIPHDGALLWLGGTDPSPLVQRQSMSPVLDLRVFASRGSRATPVRKLRRARTRAEALGTIRIERLGRDAPPRLIREAMEQLFALHSAQWQNRGETGVLMEPKLRTFHQDIAMEMAARGTLLLLRLHVGGTVAGVFYGFRRDAYAYAYATGTDPALSHIGPGTLLIGAAIETARAAGAHNFDFLRGQEAYKYAWGAVDRPTMRVTLTPRARDLGRTLPSLPPQSPTRTIRNLS